MVACKINVGPLSIFQDTGHFDLGVPSFVGRAIGYIPRCAAGMPPLSLTQSHYTEATMSLTLIVAKA
ncbi:hypothetical protein SAMN04487911_12017 [Arenibacter nanhaiticus]|uniref:Uncharacterized protein n=1 Tax=Arenibacter nanhaiticus TaxID=558155 RepID=A0A1M6J1W6_9FLAO|nr:hypothetical protein SAMN04487911_12017 [Arenibacter nanhaiticus]